MIGPLILRMFYCDVVQIRYCETRSLNYIFASRFSHGRKREGEVVVEEVETNLKIQTDTHTHMIH